MKRVFRHIGAAALATVMLASSAFPANAAATYQYPTSITGVTVSGHPLTDSELSKGSYLINLVKGRTIYFDVKSSRPVNFTSGNGSCAVTGTTWSYNSSTKTTRYTITGTGSTGQACGLYLDRNRIFQAQIINQPTSQPFISDTTDPLTQRVGDSYTFKLTLKDSNSNSTFIVGNGSVLSTYAPPGTTDANGNKVYYYTITAKKVGSSGVYVIVDGVSYLVFSSIVVTNTNTTPVVPDNPYIFTPTVTSDSGKTYKKGIDVSKWQGTIDWDTVKKTGVDFVMLRAGYGQGTIDQYFDRNISECNRLGIPVGVYWFSYAHDAGGAAQEAQSCLDAIKNYRVEYPVCFDLEYDTLRYAKQYYNVTIDKTLASNMANAFCSTIENNNYYAMNYANDDYLENHFDLSLLGDYDLWYACYPYINPPTTISDSSNTSGARMWQYTSVGTVAGISGSIDMNVSSCDYAAIIRNAGLNNLGGTTQTLRRSTSTVWNQNSLTLKLLPNATDKSTPEPGKMSQPNYHD